MMKTIVMRRDILEQEYVRPETGMISAFGNSFVCVSATVTVDEEITEDEIEIVL